MLMRHAVMPYNWDVKVAATGHNGKVIDVWKRRGTFRMATLAMSVPRLCLFRSPPNWRHFLFGATVGFYYPDNKISDQFEDKFDVKKVPISTFLPFSQSLCLGDEIIFFAKVEF